VVNKKTPLRADITDSVMSPVSIFYYSAAGEIFDVRLFFVSVAETQNFSAIKFSN